MPIRLAGFCVPYFVRVPGVSGIPSLVVLAGDRRLLLGDGGRPLGRSRLSMYTSYNMVQHLSRGFRTNIRSNIAMGRAVWYHAGMDDEVRYLSVQTIATRLGIHPETVRRWLRAGALAGYELGDKSGWRVREDDLATFLAGRFNQPRGRDAAGG